MSYWFKFYGQEFLTDPKMMNLNTEQKLMWIGLLCMASGRDSDTIKFLTEDNLKLLISLDPNYEEWKLADNSFKKFIDLEMITMPDKDTIVLLNFIKRQESHLTGAERVAKHRDKKEQSYKCNVGDVTDVTSNRIEEKRIEKKREEENIYITETFTMFRDTINPLINYGHKTNRKAVIELLKHYNGDYGKLKELVGYAISVQGKSFAPRITTPYQLKEKFASLKAYYLDQKNNKNQLISFDN